MLDIFLYTFLSGLWTMQGIARTMYLWRISTMCCVWGCIPQVKHQSGYKQSSPRQINRSGYCFVSQLDCCWASSVCCWMLNLAVFWNVVSRYAFIRFCKECCCTYQFHKFCDNCRSFVHLIPLKINQNKLVVIFFLLTDFLVLYTYNTDYLICAVFRAWWSRKA